jgi:hypothetical protein
MNEEYFDTVFLFSGIIEKAPHSFAILTACNPMDHLLSLDENKMRNLRLFRTLCNLGKSITPIIGSSPDHSHQEPSFVVYCSQGEAKKIGKEFQQKAFFWVCNDQLNIIDCTTGMIYPAGLFSERIRK